MKKKIIFILVCLTTIVLALSLTACKENTKQDAIDGDYTNAAVSSNGGFSVVYGKYLFFVNGYAGQDAENNFGKAVKGAIMRVELDGGIPKKDTLVTIVPKNVYFSGNTAAGISIYDGYIYYSAPNIDKDSEGEPKSAEMAIMRTKLDGTGTQTIATFSVHTVVYRVSASYILCVDDESNLIKIDLNTKKFKQETLDETIGSTYFFSTKTTDTYSDNGDYIVYTVTDDDGNVTVKTACVSTGKVSNILDNGKIKANIGGGKDYTYTTTLLNAIENGGKLNVFCTVTDDDTNTPTLGIYKLAYDVNNFDSFSVAKLTGSASSTVGLNYSSFYFADGKILAVGTYGSNSYSKIDLYAADGKFVSNVINFNAAATINSVYKEDGIWYCYYTASSAMYRVKLLNADTTVAEENVVKCSTVKSSTTAWLGLEIYDGVLYYFNEDISSNIYYQSLKAVKEITDKEADAHVLGTIIEADAISAF